MCHTSDISVQTCICDILDSSVKVNFHLKINLSFESGFRNERSILAPEDAISNV